MVSIYKMYTYLQKFDKCVEYLIIDALMFLWNISSFIYLGDNCELLKKAEKVEFEYKTELFPFSLKFRYIHH